MKTFITLCALIAVTFAASVDLLVAKDLLSNPANGGPRTYHNTDKYTISCCSASNPSYLFTAYNIASLAGKTVSSAILNVNVLSNNPPQRVSASDNSKNPNVQFYTATDFSETPTSNINEFPDFGTEITKVYLNNQAASSIDVTSFVKDAIAANKEFFNVAWNPSGGIGASVTVAAREANNRASFLTVVYSDSQSVESCDANLSGDNNASPARTVSQSCSNANLSGDNNASPARTEKVVCSGNGVCQGEVCKCNAGFKGAECQTPCIPSTSTAAPTSQPPVALTPKPTTTAPTTAAPSSIAPTTTAPTSQPPVGLTPKPTLPICGSENDVNLSGDNNASPARGIRSSSCSANLSGDNNASPARTVVCSGKGGCVNGKCVCNVGFKGENCEIQYCIPSESTKAPTTSAPTSTSPTTAAPTTQPPVGLTPRPTTSAPITKPPVQNESGEDNAREESGAASIVAGAAAVAAAAAALL
ncbi:hypothetical protein AKO1_012609 [Acrasis kona]|uniref:EGF-like domain-containing protein n=1 Tax=Acrasis kona TaxID=1008807 RepID=A0AAW2YUQ7_9EUKA